MKSLKSSIVDLFNKKSQQKKPVKKLPCRQIYINPPEVGILGPTRDSFQFTYCGCNVIQYPTIDSASSVIQSKIWKKQMECSSHLNDNHFGENTKLYYCP